MKRGSRAAVAATALIAMLAFAAPASAGSQDCTGPTGDQYCAETHILTGAAGSGSADLHAPGNSSAGTDSAGSLPFTGFDLALSLLAGAGLLGAGVVLRKAGQSQDAAR